MNMQQLKARLLPPPGGGIIVWMAGGHQFTAKTFTYDVNGLMYLTQQDGLEITVDIAHIVAYEYTPAEVVP